MVLYYCGEMSKMNKIENSDTCVRVCERIINEFYILCMRIESIVCNLWSTKRCVKNLIIRSKNLLFITKCKTTFANLLSLLTKTEFITVFYYAHTFHALNE